MGQTLTLLLIAQICHAANRAYCKALGDHSQPDWDNAPEWQKISAVNGVSFHVMNPEAGPAASHNSWLREKQESGWKYGPVKNPETKEHPCFVPYDELPAEQKAKDFIFCGLVHDLKSLAYLDVEKLQSLSGG